MTFNDYIWFWKTSWNYKKGDRIGFWKNIISSTLVYRKFIIETEKDE
jgi:hypothetical protein